MKQQQSHADCIAENLIASFSVLFFSFPLFLFIFFTFPFLFFSFHFIPLPSITLPPCLLASIFNGASTWTPCSSGAFSQDCLSGTRHNSTEVSNKILVHCSLNPYLEMKITLKDQDQQKCNYDYNNYNLYITVQRSLALWSHIVSNVSFPKEGLSPLGEFPRRKRIVCLKDYFKLLTIKGRKSLDHENYNFPPILSSSRVKQKDRYKILGSGLVQGHCILLPAFSEEENCALD